MSEQKSVKDLPACPVETTLTLIGDKWKVLILRDLMPGTKRFGELKKSIGNVSQKVLTGFACNPNVFGVVIIGLGCETVGHAQLREKIRGMTSKPVASFGIQEEGGTLRTIEKAVRAARDMAAEAAMQHKELCDMSNLLLGIECGGSDATSGIASNPAVGELSDLLVDLGASTIMSESSEWIGAEHVVARRAATPELHNKIIEICRDYEEHLKAAGQDCRAGQPTPGNKAGGLSTLDETSLGCIRKGGHRHGHGRLRHLLRHLHGGRRLQRRDLHHGARHTDRQRYRARAQGNGQRPYVSDDGRQHGRRSERHCQGHGDVSGKR